MKVLYLHQYFNTEEMNGSIRSYLFSNSLEKNKHDVIVLTSSRDESLSKVKVQKIGLRTIIVWIPVKYSNQMSFARRIVSFFLFFIKATFISVKIKADLVFATSTPLTIALPALTFSYLKSKPFIFEVRDLWPEVPIAMGILKNRILIKSLRVFEKFIYQKAKVVIALSPDMKDGILKINPKTKVKVLPNMASTDLFLNINKKIPSPMDKLEGKKIVLYAGTFGLVNHLEYLVELAFIMQETDVVFVFIGDGSEKEKIYQVALNNGTYNNNLFILDPVPKNKIPAYFNCASVIISTTMPIEALWKNSANKFFDAIAAKKPIVINHGGWLAKLIHDNDLGLVLPHDDIGSAAKALESFLKNETRIKEVSRNCLDLASSDFSVNTICKSFVKTIENLPYRNL